MPLQIVNVDSDADLDPNLAFHFTPIRIQPPKIMRIRIRNPDKKKWPLTKFLNFSKK
jgi:hypothetical protein